MNVTKGACMSLALGMVIGLAQITDALASKKQSDGEADTLSKKRADEALKLAQEHAEQYVVYADQDRKTRLALYDKPVLRWTNPVPQETGEPSAEVYGGVFVWTLDKRPLVVASIFRWYRPYKHVDHEMLSFSPTQVVADRDAKQEWHPSTAGVTWNAIADARPPADSARRRALQIRIIADQFSAEKLGNQDKPTRLRLLTKPLYEYECPQPEVLSGALLAFAEATDPEIVLLIEAREAGDEFKWHYAAGRLNHLRLRLYHRKQEVWSKPFVPNAKRTERTETYSQIRRRVED